MARYEDTATPFAEAQFAGVRERKQQEAKKQEKFAKKLVELMLWKLIKLMLKQPMQII